MCMKEKIKNKEIVEPEIKNKIVGILKLLIPEAQVYLFGSRAKATHQEFSDIDLALDAGSPLDHRKVNEARSVLQSLSIPYKVDLVDFHRVSELMKKSILEERVLW